MKVRAIPFKQHGITMYNAVLTAKDLASQTKVDVWHPTNEDGYQRDVSLPRAKKFGNYITTEVSPPAILANIRTEDKDATKYENGKLEIPENVLLWLVDGQHRVAGLRELLAVSGEKYQDIELPVVIMVGQSLHQEAKQFVIVNNSQKRIRTDLAERFLQKLVKVEGLDSLVNKGIRNIEWTPTAIAIVDQLNNDDHSIWHNLIKLPNEPKGPTIVSQKAFSDSLKPLLKDDGKYFRKNASYVTPILNRYWEAIKEVYPEPFAEPENYVMLKTTGVVTLHAILPRIVQIIGIDSPQKSDFVKILSKMDSIKNNSKWQSPNGEYSRMTGQKGFLIIKMDLLDELEDIAEQVAA
ncbi:MAG: DGQHR domain-containing protein [Candidatus Nitrosotenuis sp.]